MTGILRTALTKRLPLELDYREASLPDRGGRVGIPFAEINDSTNQLALRWNVRFVERDLELEEKSS